MKKFEVIAFDIDSTLTESKQEISDEMAELLSQLLSIYKVAIISGAAFKQFEWQILSKLHCDESLLENLYLLPADGTIMCHYTAGWKCEEDAPLKDEEKGDIRTAFKEALHRTGLSHTGQIYGEIVEDRGSQMNFSALGQDAPIEFKRCWDPDNSKRARIVGVLEEILPEFSFHIGGTTSIEATRKGVDKAYGLKKLISKIDIAPEKMLYIGDKLFPGGNDAPALTVGAECRQVNDPEETKSVIRDILG